MASIKAHGERWRVFVCVAGQRKTKVLRTKREALAWASATESVLRELARQTPAERFTLAQALERYRDEVTPRKRSHRWEEKRIGALLRMQSLPLALPLGKVTTAHLARWRDARMALVASGTMLRDIGLLSAVFETARRDWQWISANPLRDMGKPRRPDHRDRTITLAEVRTMLHTLGHSRGPCRSMSQAVARVFLFALRTGMRAGEICGLTWDRVHADHVRLPVTKTRPRLVPLEQRARRLVESMRGWDDVLVFGVGRQTVDALFRRARDRAGLSGFTFHDARHTAATRLAGKLDVLTLCKVFGWSSPAQAMAYYNPSPGEIARRMR